ncbi:hypothetical protein E4U35_008069 [Claviceps purpurea]|nr:hypothetical protein E4U35_008069 [Claviceps purpurea]
MFLARALALLVFVSIASGHPTILVDPVIVEDGLDYVKSTTTPDKLEAPYADMRVDSFRKEIIHAEKDTTPETSATKADFAIVKRRFSLRKLIRKIVVWQDTHISLINATPYRWHMTYNSSYGLMEWDLNWPPYISPGESVTLRARNLPHLLRPNKDAAGEVTYELEGTRQPMSFQVQYRSGTHHEVFVQFRDQLKTLSNEVNSVHNLGLSPYPGGVGFMLAGKEGDFISNGAPKQWMQSQLAEIGDLPLRSIALTRSHNSGMWLPMHRIGFETAENVLTQSRSVYEQVSNGGVRVIDYHPMLTKNGRFIASTGYWLGPRYQGMKGPYLRIMIDQLNRFMYESPGELFIWDLSHEDARSRRRHFKMLNDADVELLREELKIIKHRANLRFRDKEDITFWPLKDFISPEHKDLGQSTVIIRVPSEWAKKGNFSAEEGFVSEENFPIGSHPIRTDKVDMFVKEQVVSLTEARPSRTAGMYNMNWFLTTGVLQAYNLGKALGVVPFLLERNREAWRTLYNQSWYAMSDTTYPNIITMNNVHGGSLKAMVMVINKCFVARRCGSLGGKVNIPEGEDKEENDEKKESNGEEKDGGEE